MAAVVARVRRFNRFYTEQIGVLTEHLLASEYSLTEVRLLYEIAHRDAATAAGLAADLRLDPGYLSRVLQRLQQRGVIARTRSARDARASLLALTARGRRTFRTLDARADAEVAGLLRGLSPAAQRRLLGAMEAIESLLTPRVEEPAAYLLRDPQAGELGWIVSRHGALYWQEYRYDRRFEALVATIVGEFVAHFDPRRERCWIAEKDGEVAGSVFLVRASKAVAKLRLLYVEPSARGLGIGERLVAECLGFARAAGYRKVALWTQSELHAARHLYERAGFVRVKAEPHSSFGRDDLVAETWEVTL